MPQAPYLTRIFGSNRIEDNQDKQLFPAKDDKKWQTALNALQRFIDYAKTHYHLYKEKDKDGELNAEESLYQLFQVSLNNRKLSGKPARIHGRCRWRRKRTQMHPRAIYSGFGCVGVLQEALTIST